MDRVGSWEGVGEGPLPRSWEPVSQPGSGYSLCHCSRDFTVPWNAPPGPQTSAGLTLSRSRWERRRRERRGSPDFGRGPQWFLTPRGPGSFGEPAGGSGLPIGTYFQEVPTLKLVCIPRPAPPKFAPPAETPKMYLCSKPSVFRLPSLQDSLV